MNVADSLNLVQSTAEIFAEILKATIVVFNKEGYRVAATGHFKTKVNEWGPSTYPALTAMQRKARIVIYHPIVDEACKECIFTAVCDKKTVLHVPLLYDETVLGCISLLWYHKTNPANFEGHIQYLEQLFSTLLHNEEESALNYQENLAYFDRYDALRFSTLANVIHEGVIVLDNNSCVRDLNDQAVKLAEKPRFSLIGRHINLDFPEMPAFGAPDQHNEPLFLRKGGKTYNLRCSTRYIRRGGERRTLIILFEIVSVFEGAESALDAVSFDSIIGKSRQLRDVLEVAEKVAKSNSTILIRGESGTGKELIVQAIHHVSIRSNGPFVAINCSAIPDQLLESELFGYEAGTFTGAIKGGKEGVVQSANNGTLFLDEIGDMSYHLQAKLLRVIEGKKIKRLGSNLEIAVNVRIIAATNRDLEKMMREGEFRQDLYYRLNVIPLTLPPLRDRKEDIEALLNHFISTYNRENRKRIRGMAPGVVRLFQQYDWPGNIRELQNIVEYAVNVETGDYITLSTLKSRFPTLIEHQDGDLLRTTERDLILQKLVTYGWTSEGKKRVAQELGIGMSTLYRKIANLKLSHYSK